MRHDARAAGSLSDIWSALHRDAALLVRDSDLQCLRMLALASDDDLVAQLLLRKLRHATVLGAAPAPRALVTLNSFLEYRFGGGEARFCQLVHPSATSSYGVSVLSRIGAGLIGLSAGQTVLWPDEDGALRELQVVHVENCPGLVEWLAAPGGAVASHG